MAELVRAGEMDIPAGRLVFAVDQGRAPFHSFFAIQKMVPQAQPPEPDSGDRAGNYGAHRLGGGYGGEPVAI